MELGKEQKLEQLERVLQSRTLQNSESLKAFLRFVVEQTVDGREAQLKEYIIATEVFGRNSDYDPRIDSVVRVQAGRLRTISRSITRPREGRPFASTSQRATTTRSSPAPRRPSRARAAAFAAHALAAQEAGANGNASAAAATAKHTRTERARRGGRAVSMLLGAIIVTLGVAVLALYSSNRELRRQQQAAAAPDPSLNTEEFRAVWGPFLDDPEPPLLVLSNPTVYRFVNEADPASLAERAITLNPEQRARSRPRPSSGAVDGGESPPSSFAGQYNGMGESIDSTADSLFRPPARASCSGRAATSTPPTSSTATSSCSAASTSTSGRAGSR